VKHKQIKIAMNSCKSQLRIPMYFTLQPIGFDISAFHQPGKAWYNNLNKNYFPVLCKKL